MDSSSSRTPGPSRQRQQYRQRRRSQQPMAVRKSRSAQQHPPATLNDAFNLFWSAIQEHPAVAKTGAVFIIALVSLFLMSIFFGGLVPPNVFILDIAVGRLTSDEAEARLEAAWNRDIAVRFVVDDREWTASPANVGLRLDAQTSVEAASAIGLAGIPFGYWIKPTISADEAAMRQYLETLADEVYLAPVNARYEWRDGSVFGISGQDGLQLDVDATLRAMLVSPIAIHEREVHLLTNPLPPQADNPDRFLEAAQRFVTAPFELTTYDPFEDRQASFTALPETLVTWIETGQTHLQARSDMIVDYIEALNNAGELGLTEGRYLNPEDVVAAINQALGTNSVGARVSVRFHPSTYEVVAGDSGYRIARKTGIPFYLIEAANPDRDLSVLSPGDVVNLPSHDVTLPLPVVAHKRIVVDLETQSLVAFENGEVVFNWLISSGIAEAPTSPGIYQILNHEPVAYGSSYTLCSETGCGQWEMNWFMGIYEAVPGLINGFHGAVLLPNGNYLGGNSVGSPYTLGCVMSQDDQARQLYDWAEDGTIVEIISSEFPPQSELARNAINR